MKDHDELGAEDLLAIYGDEEIVPPPHIPHPSGEIWSPPFTPTQVKAWKSRARYILLYGERFSGKSWLAGHCIVRHCYDNPNAHALVVVGVRRQATAGGIWHKILTDILPEWRMNLDGFEHSDQKQDTQKDLFIWISNRFGGWSMIQLISIPYGSNLGARVRGIEASLIFVDELVGIGGPEYFDDLIQQVGRRPGIPPENQQYIAATNPDGPSHWVYKKFFVDSKNKDGTQNPKYAIFHLPFAENPSPNAKEYFKNVEEAVRSRPIEADRMLRGIWVDMPIGTALFRDEFSEERHIYGKADTQRGLMPIVGYPIIVGYDIGNVHTGIVLMQAINTEFGPYFVVFDELCFYDKRVQHKKLTRVILQKMAYWNRRMEYVFEYKHISDDQAITHFNPERGSTGARDLLDFSTEIIEREPERFPDLKPIRVVGCPKPPGSIEARAAELMNALHDNMIAVSAICSWVKGMFFHLPRAKDNVMEPENPHKYKHVFDAMTYVMYFRRYVQVKGFIESSKVGSAVTVSTN